MGLILSRVDVKRCLSMTGAIRIMRSAFNALYHGRAEMPPRLVVDLSEQGLALLMPSLLQTPEQNAFGLKVITVMPHNPSRKMLLIALTNWLLPVYASSDDTRLRRPN
jgi:ornithine cyclodeaminase/alanine dehydrogenase-like protein (mu-crystallin family)